MKYLIPILLSFTLFPSIILSQAYVINDYVVNVKISRDGHFDVNEKITVTFYEERRGIFRNIPRKIKVDGESIKVKLSNVSVENNEYKLLAEGNDHVIRIGNKDKYISGQHVYDIGYRIDNAFLFAEDHTAFQYNIINDWDATIEKLSYTVELPDNLPLSTSEYRIMTGDRGESEQHVSIAKASRKLSGKSLTVLRPQENVTVAIKLPYNYITRPAPPVPLYKRDRLWFVPVGVIMLFISLFRRQRQTDENITITDEYFPPSEFSPAMVGAYYDNEINTEDIISLLPYWADLGYIKIIKGEDILFFKRLKSLEPDKPEYQRIIFENIFINEDMIMLTDLKEKMYKHTSKAKGVLHKQLLGMNLYDPDYMRIFKSPLLIILGVFLLLGAIAVALIFQYFFTALGMFLLAITSFILYSFKPKKSELGIQIKNHLLGLKQFLENSPQEKTAELISKHPNYFEHMYPYAIAFGIDKTWLQNMKSHDLAAPYWYTYDNNHSSSSRPTYNDFSKDFDVPEIKSIFTSYPASASGSSGSGGSSGGFSGGAGGGFGGGGGSW